MPIDTCRISTEFVDFEDVAVLYGLPTNVPRFGLFLDRDPELNVEIFISAGHSDASERHASLPHVADNVPEQAPEIAHAAPWRPRPEDHGEVVQIRREFDEENIAFQVPRSR